METANKSTPPTNKATMGNNTSGSGNDNNKTMDTKSTPATTTASSSIGNKTKNTNSEKPNKPQPQAAQALEQQACAKNDTKEAIKTPTVNDQSKTQKSEPFTTANSKATNAPTTIPTTTTSTTNKPSTTTSDSPASSTDAKNSLSSSVPIESKDDIKPPPANTEDKSSSSKQPENSVKNRNFISAAPASSSASGGEENLKPATDSFGATVHQYQKQNKPLHNSFQNQHHPNNSQGNQQQPQQSQQPQQPQQSQQPQQQQQLQQQQQQNLHQPNNSNQYHSHFQHQHQGNDEQLSKTNLYIRGLNADTSDSDLYTLCNRFGSIVSTKAILDKSTNKCKGYGFVDFDNPASAEMAVTELQKQGILVHMAKQQEADPTNLYLANLPTTMTESDLENLLRPYGQVVSTRILINQHRQHRGVGFARMETKEQCDSIIALLNGQVIKGSKEPLLVKFADGANKKRPHHFQHKPLGGNLFMGNHMRRNNGNDTNHYHMMNSGGSRNFHGGSFSEHSRQNHALTHHDNGLIKHQQMLTSMPGYHPHHQGGGHPSYMMQQPQMMGPTSAIDPSMHYVNIANQMQGLQIGNHPVSGYMSPQQWPGVWPPGGSSAFSSNSNTSRDTILR